MCRLFILTSVISVLKISGCSNTAEMDFKAMDFEIFGKVQGVFFRMHTKHQAELLGLRGWCKNTRHGTVQGHMQGPHDKVETMMHWLETTGSPSSIIDKAEFTNQTNITEYTFDNFRIVSAKNF